jgi:hypothetical protein
VRRRGKLFGGRLKASSLPALIRRLTFIIVSLVPDAYYHWMSKFVSYPFVKCGLLLPDFNIRIIFANQFSSFFSGIDFCGNSFGSVPHDES